MDRYLPIDFVSLPTTVTKFAPEGCCDWCGKELPKRCKRFCPPVAFGEHPYVYSYSPCAIAFGHYLYSRPAYQRAVFIRDNFTCQKCGHSAMRKDQPWLPELKDLHCDHIIPLSKGGEKETDNLQTLCATCNLAKGSRLEEEAEQAQVLPGGFAQELLSGWSTIRSLTGTSNLKSVPHCECGGRLNCVGAIGRNGYDPLLLKFICVRCERQIWLHGSILSREIIKRLTLTVEVMK